MRTHWLKMSVGLIAFAVSVLQSAGAATEYQTPSKEILQLADVKQAPSFIMDQARKNALMLYRDNYKTIAELSEQELRLGGLRIDPKTNIGSRVTFYNDVKVLYFLPIIFIAYPIYLLLGFVLSFKKSYRWKSRKLK